MDDIVQPSIFRRVFGGRHGPVGPVFDAGETGDEASPSLFRPGSLTQGFSDLYGRPVAQLPVSWTFLTFLLVAAVVASFVLMATTSYARKESARGLLEPVDGDAKVTGPDRGTVSRVYVHEGDHVRQGDVLLTVSTERADLNGRVSQATMLTSLDEQEANLSRRLSSISDGGDLDDAAHLAQQASLAAARKTASADLSAAREQYAIVQEDYARILPVAERGFISASDVRRRRQAVVAARQAVDDAAGQVSSLRAQFDQAKALAAKRPFDTDRDRGVLEDTLSDLRQRRDQYRQSRGFAVRAPIEGLVTSIQASRGELADPIRPLLSIVPERAALKAVIYVPSRAIGFLRAGQRVRMRYDAFPFATVGAAMGTVITVSHTVLRPEDIDGAIRLEEPSYRVEVRPDRQRIASYGEARALLPGMALTADIILERRSFLHWLMQPLYAAGATL